MHLGEFSAESGRATAQAVSRRPNTAEVLVLSWVSPYMICGPRSRNGTGFCSSASVFPRHYYFSSAPYHTHVTVSLTRIGE